MDKYGYIEKKKGKKNILLLLLNMILRVGGVKNITKIPFHALQIAKILIFVAETFLLLKVQFDPKL